VTAQQNAKKSQQKKKAPATDDPQCTMSPDVDTLKAQIEELNAGTFSKGTGHTRNQTTALLITSAELSVLSITPNTHMTRRWNISTLEGMSNNMISIRI
jgi:hypothetical protein